MGPGRAGPTPRAGGRRGLLCAGHAASRAQPVRAGGGSDMGRWQDMTDEELDRQYSPSRWSHRMEKDAVIEAHVRELAEGTRRAQDTLQTRLHVPYGDSDGEKLDMYLPTEPSGAFPLLLYIHGGYWQFLSKEVSGFAAPPLVTRGVAVAAVGYDVAPKGCMDAMVAQVRRSVAFLVQQYPAISGVFLCGHSAGAHLAAMVLSTDWGEYGVSPDIRGAFLVSGVYDLEPITHTYVNSPLRMSRPCAPLAGQSPCWTSPTRITLTSLRSCPRGATS
ncbi:kynurenine formamidase isoform X5 [Pelodiscus sinensis]|uniref:kynurenine formamidase isoform X5 n=1 Tax=Pelodiscus sinensis TaxID=13735 RepID=UPI003F6C0AB3